VFPSRLGNTASFPFALATIPYHPWAVGLVGGTLVVAWVLLLATDRRFFAQTAAKRRRESAGWLPSHGTLTDHASRRLRVDWQGFPSS